MWVSILAVLSMCVLRLALWRWKGVTYSRADETSVMLQVERFRWSDFRMAARFYTRCPAYWDTPGPMRVGALVTLAAMRRVLPGFEGQSLVSTVSGCVVVAASEGIAAHLQCTPGVVAALVGSCPLVLGLGRRALQDMPLLALQTLAMLVIAQGATWAPLALALLVAGLLFKESSLPGLVGLFAWAVWQWGGVALPVAVFGAAVLAWYGFMSWLVCEPLHRFVVRLMHLPPSTDPYQRLIRGGVHRLLVDMILTMPVGVLFGVAYMPDGAPGVMAVLGAALLGYGVFILQEIRIAVLLSVLLRIGLALCAPWWAVALCVACDAYVYVRVWYKQDLYDPTTVWLAQFLGMGP